MWAIPKTNKTVQCYLPTRTTLMNLKPFLMSSMITANLKSVKGIPILLVRTLPHFSPSSIWFRSVAKWIIQCRHWPRANCTGRPHFSWEVISRILMVQSGNLRPTMQVVGGYQPYSQQDATMLCYISRIIAGTEQYPIGILDGYLTLSEVVLLVWRVGSSLVFLFIGYLLTMIYLGARLSLRYYFDKVLLLCVKLESYRSFGSISNISVVC